MDIYYSKDKKTCCSNNSNNLIEIIEKIARTQRDVCSTCGDCVSCDNCFCNALYNTIPIRLTYCCSGNTVEGVIGLAGATTAFFRVECITNNRFVKLRLLSVTTVEGEIVVTGTNYTMVVDMECIGTIQCFEPVNIAGCTVTGT